MVVGGWLLLLSEEWPAFKKAHCQEIYMYASYFFQQNAE